MVEIEKRDLKTSDAAKLLQEYRFQREASLRSIQHSRISLALTCFIIAFASLQIALTVPKYSGMAYISTVGVTMAGAIFALLSLLPLKEAMDLSDRNEEFLKRIEDYFEGR